MPRYPRVREQHIAVFGAGGSGKTVLISSFFGRTQEGSYTNDLWDLVADDLGQGVRLYQNFLGMRDRATRPLTTRFASKTYYFTLKLKGGLNASAARQPFDALRLAWHDYPGEWFEQSPTSDKEAAARIETFRSLLRSDVAIFLVDGQRLVDYAGEEERYLKSVLNNFKQGLLGLKDDLLAGEGPLIEFPRIWIMALSKADLLPDWDVDTFRDLVIGKAAEDLDGLRSTLQSFVNTPEALDLGQDYMLLSSARFELSSADADPVEIDVTKRVGLDLLIPVASLLPLERRVQWSERMDIPVRVLEGLADGAEVIAAALTGGRFAVVERLVARLPRVGPLAGRIAVPALLAAVQMAGAQLEQINSQARAQGDYLRATLTQFKLDLERGAAERVIRSPK